MSEQHPRAVWVRVLLTSIAVALAAVRLVRAAIAAIAVDVTAISGAGLIVYGIGRWSAPAAYIAAGVFLLWVAVRYSRVAA